eukprot:CAMPEP_0170280552 /NCGR_PEP_ID=MMETSP0116_2-20130129/40290_1 /TAXON_ID=400756 /ORGANISM="Durinskia baltica, Strain CSIRO CS-38" /LENGTH=907 /DNA_ID=CAMNT_0010531883 /DNA_START=1 /DNA_END=2721 /DNA_ORIENTATION=+
MQKQRGEDCAFRLLIFASAYHFDTRVREFEKHRGSAPLAKHFFVHFFRACDEWSSKEPSFETAMKHRFGDDKAFWPRFDLDAGRYSLIMFECLERDQIKEQTPHNFQNDFISSLVKIPAIAVQTYGTDQMKRLQAMAEHVARGSTLMLIDSRNRPDKSSQDLDCAKKELNNFAKRLHADRDEAGNISRSRADWYSTSAMAFIRRAVDSELRTLRASLEGAGGPAGGKKAAKAKRQSTQWLHEAIAAIRCGKQQRDQERSGGQSSAMNHESNFNEKQGEILVKATDMLMRYVGSELQWEAETRHRRCRQAIEALKQTTSLKELKGKLEDGWPALRGCTLHFYKDAEKLAEDFECFHMRDNGEPNAENWYKGQKMLVVQDGGDGGQYESGEKFELAKRELIDMLQKQFWGSYNMDRETKFEEAFAMQEDKWMAAYEIFKSEDVYTGSLYDLQDCSKRLSDIAKIDYLPAQNSYEALILIRRAWTLHDVFDYHALNYKMIAKSSTFIMLLLSTALVSLVAATSLLTKDRLPFNWDTIEPNLMLGLSLGSSFVAGFSTLLEPTRKWLHLRGAALHLESEIWKFRTRMGDYSGGAAARAAFSREVAEREAEAVFKQMLLNIQEKVGGAGLKRTPFYSVATTADDDDGDDGQESALRKQMKHTRHGQFKVGSFAKGSPKKDMDNFHTPQLPEGYVRHRLLPLRDFYQKKIPKCAGEYRLYQACLLLSSVASVLIVSMSSAQALTAVVAAISASVMAWQEFTGVEKKLDRHSNIANILEQTLLWWQALPADEKKDLNNTEKLIISVEALIAGERVAWMSDTQQAAAKMKKQLEQRSGEEATPADQSIAVGKALSPRRRAGRPREACPKGAAAQPAALPLGAAAVENSSIEVGPYGLFGPYPMSSKEPGQITKAR